MATISIEGYRAQEILDLPDAALDAWVFTGQPFVFRVGTAQILGEFRRDERRISVELAQIEGGGEGVLPAL